MNVQTQDVILDPAIVRGKGRPKGSKNKQRGHGITSTQRDPSQFEYLPSSSTPPALGIQSRRSESSAISSFMAHVDQILNLSSNSDENEGENEGENEDEFTDINQLIDPQLRSTT
jgi:hypothetical protein